MIHSRGLDECINDGHTVESNDNEKSNPVPVRSNLLTTNVTAALDRVGVTDRKAEIILDALIKDNHLDASKQYNTNYSSIRRHRMKNREMLSDEVFFISFTQICANIETFTRFEHVSTLKFR